MANACSSTMSVSKSEPTGLLESAISEIERVTKIARVTRMHLLDVDVRVFGGGMSDGSNVSGDFEPQSLHGRLELSIAELNSIVMSVSDLVASLDKRI